MAIITLFVGAVLGGMISWVITHLYYQKSTTEQKAITSKLSREVKEAILNLHTEKLTVKDLNKLLEEKTIDGEANGDPLPFKACPKCGSTKLERGSADYHDDLYYFIKCTECEWNEWSQ